MRYSRIVGLVLTLAVLAGVMPAQAQGNPAVTDQGNNIYLVDGTQAQIPNLLPAEEVQKIAALQRIPAGTFFVILSPVSSDDQTILVATSRGFGFTNIRDGSTVPFPQPPNYAQLSNWFWLNDETLASYGVTLPDLQPIMYGADRRTGVGQVLSPVPAGLGFPVFVSANGRKVLFAAPPLAATALTVPAPGSGAQAASLPTALSAASRLPAGSRARALVDFAALFDPIPAGSVASQVFNVNTRLTVVDVETGEARPVATLPAGSAPGELSFSQDGSKFALTVELGDADPDRGLDGARISELGYRDATGNLPPAQNPWLQGNQLIALDFGSGEVTTLRAADGDGAIYRGVSWSPDNQTLAVTVQQPSRLVGRRYPTYLPENRASASLRLLDSGLREIRRLERVELSDSDMRASFVSPDELIIQSHYRLDEHPHYYNWRSGELRTIADRAGTFAGVTATNRSREIVFLYTSFTDPVDVYRMKWDGTAFARLTWLNEAARQLSKTRQQPVSFTLRDGSTHSGVLILPADAPFPPKNLPIIVWQEGGPRTHIKNQWIANIESPFGLLPNFGFGLLVVPLYGRLGTGPDRFEALSDGANFGQIDIDAMNEIVGQMRARGWASKVGITGCSYGGYFTVQSLIRHPATYDAAHTMCTISDAVTEWSRGYATAMPFLQGLPPRAALAEYAKDSPSYNAGKVRTPLLAFHGTEDFLPVTVMENFMLEVINNKVPAKLLKFQDAPHGFNTIPPYELYGAQEQLIWFRTYLMGQ